MQKKDKKSEESGMAFAKPGGDKTTEKTEIQQEW